MWYHDSLHIKQRRNFELKGSLKRIYLCKQVALQSAILYEFFATSCPRMGAPGRSLLIACMRSSSSMLVLEQFPYGAGRRLISLATSPIVAEIPDGMSKPSRLGFAMVSGCWTVTRTPSVPAAGARLFSKPATRIQKNWMGPKMGLLLQGTTKSRELNVWNQNCVENTEKCNGLNT